MNRAARAGTSQRTDAGASRECRDEPGRASDYHRPTRGNIHVAQNRVKCDKNKYIPGRVKQQTRVAAGWRFTRRVPARTGCMVVLANQSRPFLHILYVCSGSILFFLRPQIAWGAPVFGRCLLCFFLITTERQARTGGTRCGGGIPHKRVIVVCGSSPPAVFEVTIT